MSKPVSMLLTGDRLHLQHGPIDLIIGAQGEQRDAFDAAEDRFRTVLSELVDEIDELRQALTSATTEPKGEIAQRMHRAATRLRYDAYLTRMASVAGSVADTVLEAIVESAKVSRAYVNNGGDIALHLGDDQSYISAISTTQGVVLGCIDIKQSSSVRGIATSGRGGRSVSLGIADSVTVLAENAAIADTAATLIANAVDLPGHKAVHRQPASQLQDDSDMGDLLVVTNCDTLSKGDCCEAMNAGAVAAQKFIGDGHIHAAAIVLQGKIQTVSLDAFLN